MDREAVLGPEGWWQDGKRGPDVSLRAVALSGDGRFAASAYDVGSITLWDLSSGQAVRQFGIPQMVPPFVEAVLALSFTPDGKYVLAASANGRVRRWDTATGKQVDQFRPQGRAVCALCVSRDGRRALTGDAGGMVRLWDTATGKKLREFAAYEDGVTQVALSADGRWGAAAGQGPRRVCLWQLDRGEFVWERPVPWSPTRALAFSPDGQVVQAGQDKGMVWAWRVRDGREIGHWLPDKDASVTAFSPDLHLALAERSRAYLHPRGDPAADEHAVVWDLHSHERVARLDAWGTATARAFSADGNSVLWADLRVLRLYDAHGGDEIRTLAAPLPSAPTVSSVAFSPDGKLALSASQTGRLRLWDVATGKRLRTFAEARSSFPGPLAISPDGRWALAVTSSYPDEPIKLWDVQSGDVRGGLGGRQEHITLAGFSPDSQLVVTASDSPGGLKVWEVPSGRCLRVIPEPDRRFTAVGFLPRGKRIFAATASPVGFPNEHPGVPHGPSLSLWDANTGQRVRQFGEGDDLGVVLSPDCRVALTFSDRPYRLWDLTRGKTLATGRLSGGYPVALAPDGRFALLRGHDGGIAVWDVATGKSVRWFVAKGVPLAPTAYALSPDSKLALTGEFGGTMRLWDIDSGRQIRAFDVANWEP